MPVPGTYFFMSLLVSNSTILLIVLLVVQTLKSRPVKRSVQSLNRFRLSRLIEFFDCNTVRISSEIERMKRVPITPPAGW